MDKSKSYNIQKFEGKNFQLWKFQLEIIFRAEGLLDLVNGKTERPEDDREKEKAWDDKNAKAMLIISTAMEFDQLQVIIACKNAAEMWMRLKTIHEQRSAVNKIALKQQFFYYKMLETDTVAQHISKIETMAQSLADVGEPVGAIDKIAKTLGSLLLKYARLLKEEQRLVPSDELTSALAAIKESKSKLSSSSGNETKRNFSQKNVECYFCHKRGHFKSECQNYKAREMPNNHKVIIKITVQNFEKRSTSRYALLEWPILQNNEEAEGAQLAERNEVTAENENAEIEQIENTQLWNRENIQPPAHYRDDIMACAAVLEEPQTYEEAKSSNEMQQWQESMGEEIRSLNKNNIWTLVPLPENRKVYNWMQVGIPNKAQMR
ncbi:hypothetical protein QE152_g20814 [Popillia japonica]|uniref:CCHC-type domain-containing protein n=1 Tax=Popillia japonica TaxID=7064 RepID=A0AAW1KPH8_POPJA